MVEIKCPCSCKDRSILESSSERTFCLERRDDSTALCLKQNHQYYYQVQAQIKLSNANYCDFVVWREEELFVQKIYPDDEFMAVALQKVTTFLKFVLPELLGKWYTTSQVHVLPSQSSSTVDSVSSTVDSVSSTSSQNVWCYYRKGKEGEIIECDRKECPFGSTQTALR